MFEQQVAFYENYKKTVNKISELESKADKIIQHRIDKLRKSFEKLNSKYEVYQIGIDQKNHDEQYKKLNYFLSQQKDLQDRIFCLEQQIIYANNKKTQNQQYVVNQSRLSILEEELFQNNERFQNFKLKKNDYLEVTEIINELKDELEQEKKQINKIFQNLSFNCNKNSQKSIKSTKNLNDIRYQTKDLKSSIDLNFQNLENQSVSIQQNIYNIQSKFKKLKNIYNSMRI